MNLRSLSYQIWNRSVHQIWWDLGSRTSDEKYKYMGYDNVYLYLKYLFLYSHSSCSNVIILTELPWLFYMHAHLPASYCFASIAALINCCPTYTYFNIFIEHLELIDILIFALAYLDYYSVSTEIIACLDCLIHLILRQLLLISLV
jgi:hypothetical protein